MFLNVQIGHEASMASKYANRYRGSSLGLFAGKSPFHSCSDIRYTAIIFSARIYHDWK